MGWSGAGSPLPLPLDLPLLLVVTHFDTIPFANEVVARARLNHTLTQASRVKLLNHSEIVPCNAARLFS